MPCLELIAVLAAATTSTQSSIDPHAVLNKFAFLRLTPRCAIAAAPILAMFIVNM